jgi:hypothetical protein
VRSAAGREALLLGGQRKQEAKLQGGEQQPQQQSSIAGAREGLSLLWSGRFQVRFLSPLVRSRHLVCQEDEACLSAS